MVIYNNSFIYQTMVYSEGLKKSWTYFKFSEIMQGCVNLPLCIPRQVTYLIYNVCCLSVLFRKFKQNNM